MNVRSGARSLFLLAVVAGCGDPTIEPGALPESDVTGASLAQGRWAVAGGWELVQTRAGLELVAGAETRHLADFVVGTPAVSADGTRFAFSHRPATASSTRLDVGTWSDAGWSVDELVGRQWHPDEAALDPEGRRVAFASSARGGLASVWVVEVDAEEPTPVQLTNVGLTGGHGRPEGFVPPPSMGAPRFVGSTLQWDSSEGLQTVEVSR